MLRNVRGGHYYSVASKDGHSLDFHSHIAEHDEEADNWQSKR